MAFKHSSGDLAGKWEIEGKVIGETPKAVHVDDGVMRAWLPKRFVKLEPMQGGRVAVLMPEWLAKKEKYV